MIGVSSKPSLSSSLLMAATRPSIMSEGATISAPASAWEDAVRARSSRLISFRTRPVFFSTTPQCPWLMYSQRHTSVTTSSSGIASFIARVASWTMPSGS
jgi:hypothetical protein